MIRRRAYKFVGPEYHPPKVKEHQRPLSPQNAMGVIRTAWANGRFHLGTHFRKRSAERDIDMLDVENLIRNGAIRGVPEYCPDYKNWKYQVTGFIDERHLEVVIALDPTEDYTNTPLAILVTAYLRPE